MLELRGLRGEELLEAYRANHAELARIIAPYIGKSRQEVPRYSFSPNGVIVKCYQLINEKYADIFEEKYGEYIQFYPREMKGELSILFESVDDGPVTGSKPTIREIEKWQDEQVKKC